MAAPAMDGAPMANASTVDIGIDLAGIDHVDSARATISSVHQRHWLKTAQIPADRSSTGSFLQVYQIAEKRTADLIQNLAKVQCRHPVRTNARLPTTTRPSWMKQTSKSLDSRRSSRAGSDRRDQDARRSRPRAGQPMRADVDPINATNFHTENLFGLFVTQGLEDRRTTMAYLLQGGLAMPSRDYYLSQDPQMVAFRSPSIRPMSASLLKLAGTPDADAQAKAIIALETKIAQAQESLVDSQDVHKANNVWSVSDFAQKAPGMNWTAYFKAAGLERSKADRYMAAVGHHRAVRAGRERAARNVEATAALSRHRRCSTDAAEAYADLNFDFYGTTLQGTPQQQERWKRAVVPPMDRSRRRGRTALCEAIFPCFVESEGAGRW
jgi:putative endopeptidase